MYKTYLPQDAKLI